MTKISIVGTGYVGLVTGTCLAEAGHEVICSDINKEKISLLQKGVCPIYEPGLEELIKKNVEKKRLSFTTNVPCAIANTQVVFSAVGTPMGENHEADLKYVKEVAKTFAQTLKQREFKLFVNKSTVPVGTGDIVKKIISDNSKNIDFDVISNPEFLKEGAAVNDFLKPERIVIGFSNQKSKEIMAEVYEPFTRQQSPIMFTDVKSAELIKYASNSMLATRISFMNELARFSEVVGADIKEVAKGMGFDSRIGPKFLQAGLGYGGSCFPKDVVALIESAKQVGVNLELLKSVEKVNFIQKTIIVDKLEEELGDLKGKTIGIWGLSFKPKTDDVREASAKYIISKLLQKKAKIQAYDPITNENFKQEFNFDITYCSTKEEVCKSANALVLITEWDEFRIFNSQEILGLMNSNLLIDGRNIYNPKKIQEKGFKYLGIGR